MDAITAPAGGPSATLPLPDPDTFTTLPGNAGEGRPAVVTKRAASDVFITTDSPTSIERLGTFPVASDGHLPFPATSTRRSSFRRSLDGRGKGKSVAWGSDTAPPAEVLARSGLNVLGTSAGSTDSSVSQSRSSRVLESDEPPILQGLRV